MRLRLCACARASVGARRIWAACADGPAHTCLVLEDDARFEKRELSLLVALFDGALCGGRGEVEGGMLNVSGDGLILVTEECLLSSDQERNAGFSKGDYEEIFREYLGCSSTIWLPWGVVGDDTHGHIDNVARFVAPRTVVVASADRSDTAQYERLQQNIEAIKKFRTPSGERLTIVELPFPEPRYCDGLRLSAGYLNFYFANGIVLMPTYNDKQDRVALGILSELLPDRTVIGINCSDWILGGGSLHCSTQQEPEWGESITI